MRRVFIDTGAFVALRNASEHEHDAARQTFSNLVGDGVDLFTSNYVVAETYTALLVRVGHDEALTWGRRVREPSAIEVLTVDESIEDDAWDLLERHVDKRWSFVDATSFALLDHEGSDEAFAFDRHFTQRGLVVHPPSARRR